MSYIKHKRTAHELKQNLPILTLIDDEINKLLTMIYSKIDDVYRINEIEVIVNLPTHFNHLACKFMSINALRDRIYYKIVTGLEEQGYKVGLKKEQDLVLLKVSWTITINNEENKKMNDKFNSIEF
jgi:hypothetical protein